MWCVAILLLCDSLFAVMACVVLLVDQLLVFGVVCCACFCVVCFLLCWLYFVAGSIKGKIVLI